MSYPERPHSAIPPMPDDGDGCQACEDGVKHVSCEPYFEALVERVGPLPTSMLASAEPVPSPPAATGERCAYVYAGGLCGFAKDRHGTGTLAHAFVPPATAGAEVTAANERAKDAGRPPPFPQAGGEDVAVAEWLLHPYRGYSWAEWREMSLRIYAAGYEAGVAREREKCVTWVRQAVSRSVAQSLSDARDGADAIARRKDGK